MRITAPPFRAGMYHPASGTPSDAANVTSRAPASPRVAAPATVGCGALVTRAAKTAGKTTHTSTTIATGTARSFTRRRRPPRAMRNARPSHTRRRGWRESRCAGARAGEGGAYGVEREPDRRRGEAQDPRRTVRTSRPPRRSGEQRRRQCYRSDRAEPVREAALDRGVRHDVNRENDQGTAEDTLLAARATQAFEHARSIAEFDRSASLRSGAEISDAYELFQQGRRHLRNGMAAQATVALEKAKRLEPEKASIREALGIAYLRLSRPDEAAAEFRKILELAPADDFAHYALGRCLELQGNRAEANGHYKLASSLRPDSEQYAARIRDLDGG